MPDANEALWAVIDAATAELTADDLRSLAPAAEWLLSSGIIAETSGRGTIACPECPDGHVEDVVSVPGDEHGTVWISCPRLLRVRVDPQMLRRWIIRWDKLAAALSNALGLSGKSREIEPGRVWRLGTTDWQQSRREVVMAIGAAGSVCPRLGEHVGRAGRAIVLTTGAIPPANPWPGRVPACISAKDVLTVGPAGFELDAVHLADAIRAADEAARQVGGLTLDEDQLKDVIRRQVRAAQKKELTDDLMIQAVAAAGGSARKAAKALKDEGYEVHHSTISRAVKRHKDAAKLVRAEDSASVARTVASQHRDRSKKSAQYRN